MYSVTQLCLTLCNPYGLKPARLLCPWDFPGKEILEWVAFSYCKGSSQPRDQTCVSRISCFGKQILYRCGTWEAPPVFIAQPFMGGLLSWVSYINPLNFCFSLCKIKHSSALLTVLLRGINEDLCNTLSMVCRPYWILNKYWLLLLFTVAAILTENFTCPYWRVCVEEMIHLS